MQGYSLSFSGSFIFGVLRLSLLTLLGLGFGRGGGGAAGGGRGWFVFDWPVQGRGLSDPCRFLLRILAEP